MSEGPHEGARAGGPAAASSSAGGSSAGGPSAEETETGGAREEPTRGSEPSQGFVPYIRAEQTVPELTAAALALGLLQAVLFGVADAYLGLKLGMTVGASIPAAVISMGILRGVLRRGSVLENNVVQNMASVGESLAAGVAFTVPSLFLLAAAHMGGLPTPSTRVAILLVALLAGMGGLLGILFMIPLRRSLIVKEHGRLPYPEGTACAGVLVAGDAGGESARLVFRAIGLAAIYRFCMNGLDLFKEKLEFPVEAGWFGAGGTWKNPLTTMSFDLLPSLLAVGFILEIETCAMMLSGALLGWFVIIPCISWAGHEMTTALAPGTIPIGEMGPDGIRSTYLRYIGAGAVTFGGLVSLVRAIPTFWESFTSGAREIAAGLRGEHAESQAGVPRTARDIPTWWVLGGAFGVFLGMTMLLWVLLGRAGLGATAPLLAGLGALMATVFAFFFVTVASRMVGIVGSTSMPIAGMTIGALIATCLVLKALGLVGAPGIMATLVIGAVVCIAISLGGDISQDLKIGFLVGATPRVVQVTQMIALLVSAVSVGIVVTLLSPGVLSGQLEAPQAKVMFMLTQGIMSGELPWVLLFIGMGVAACVEMLGIGSLPFAIGLYLPLATSTTIMIGGLLHWLATHRVTQDLRKAITERGLLVASGLVAGDAIVGVVIGVMMAFERTLSLIPVPRDFVDLPFIRLLPACHLPWEWWDWPTAALFALLTLYLYRTVTQPNRP